MGKARQLRAVLTAVALVTVLTGCAAISGRETSGQYVDDATITSKVKADVFDDSSLKVMEIHVETFQGVVQLSGFVDSRYSKDRADQIARNVSGVRDVKDSLVVR
jgi:hyperosmotically inducible periplasmic protein